MLSKLRGSENREPDISRQGHKPRNLLGTLVYGLWTSSLWTVDDSDSGLPTGLTVTKTFKTLI